MTPSLQQNAPTSLNLIRLYRRAMGMTLFYLAKSINVYTNTVLKWEYGRQLLRFDHALVLAATLDCPVEVLFYHLYADAWTAVGARRPALRRKRSSDICAYSSIASLKRSLAQASKHARRLFPADKKE